MGLFEGDYDGPAFSGDSPDNLDPASGDVHVTYEWDGAEDDSVSVATFYDLNWVDDPDGYQEWLRANTRFMHDCKVTAGPYLRRQFTKDGVNAGILEFTVTSERGYLYTPTKPIALPQSPPTAVQDIQYNLIPYPSAEIADDEKQIIFTNYVTNPSLETSETGWSGGTRVTGENRAIGDWSYKGSAASPNPGSEIVLTYSGTLDFGDYNVSAGVWVAGDNLDGISMRMRVGAEPWIQVGDTADMSGVFISDKQIPKPYVANTFEVEVSGFRIGGSGTGTLWVDALFVTRP